MVKIGDKVINTNVFAAPLAGCSDLSYRLISREHGAQFCFYEMVDSNSIVRRKKAGTGDILKSHEKDSPIAAQLLGSDPDMILDAAEKLLGFVKAEFLDINCACPAKKAIRKKSGAYLLKDTVTLGRILKKVSGSIDIPVTVKIRIGFDRSDPKEMRELINICQDNGAKGIFVHGRTSAQGYIGDVNYSAIRAVKENCRIPVFGSGNVMTPELAKRMLDETGCDGILVARGGLGNPWIFENIAEYFKNGTVKEDVSMSLRMAVLKRHLKYVDELKEILPASKIGFMRKVAIWYMRGFPNATRMRALVSAVHSYAQLIELLNVLEAKNTHIPDRVSL